jgi:hypothetical protein
MPTSPPAQLTRAELRELPPVVDLRTACALLNIGRTLGYSLAQRGEFPCRVLRLGHLYRVSTASLLELLGESSLRVYPTGADEHMFPTATAATARAGDGAA